MFIWKFIHRAIAAKSELKRRKMQIDSICQQCGEHEETVEHIFFHCEKVQRIWAIPLGKWDELYSQSHNFTD